MWNYIDEIDAIEFGKLVKSYEWSQISYIWYLITQKSVITAEVFSLKR